MLLIVPVVGLGLFAVLPLPIALPVYLAVSAPSVFVYWATYQAMHRPVTTGPEGMVGAWAKAVTDLSPTGHIRYRGELWFAEADEVIASGTRVTIECVEGMRLRVRSATDVSDSDARDRGRLLRR